MLVRQWSETGHGGALAFPTLLLNTVVAREAIRVGPFLLRSSIVLQGKFEP